MKNNKTKLIAIAGLLIALGTVLSFFHIAISNVMEIRFTSFVFAVAGYVMGPVWGGVVGAATDILGWLVRPTGPFFPGFSISNVVTAVIYALFFHKRKVALWRVVVAEAVNMVVVHLILNSLWLSMLYGNGFIALIGARIVKQLISLPIYAAATYFLLKMLEKTPVVKTFFVSSKENTADK